MSDADTKILDRVKKLLELGSSSNPNEAANALAQAQKLMNRHKISQAMLIDFDPSSVGEILDDLLHRSGERITTWKSRLAYELSRVNQCSIYNNRHTGEIRVVGHQANVDTVRYFFNYIYREIDRLCKEAIDERGTEEGFTRGEGKNWAFNFRLGAVKGVAEKLAEAHKNARAEMRQEAVAGDTLGNGKALVRVNTAIEKIAQQTFDVDEWLKQNLKLKPGARRRYSKRDDAQELGFKAGQKIDVSSQSKGALGSGGRRALS